MKKYFLIVFMILIGSNMSVYCSNLIDFSFKPDSTKTLRKGKISFSAGYGLGNIYSLNQNMDERIKGKKSGPYHLKLSAALNDFVEVGVNCNYVETNVLYKDNPDVLTGLIWFYLDLALYNQGFNGNTWDTNHYIYAYNVKSISLNTRINFHFGKHKKIDPYCGIGIGYKTRTAKLIATNNLSGADSEKFPDTKKYIFPVGFELTAGIRFFPIENIGIYAEIGPAKSWAQFGLILRY